MKKKKLNSKSLLFVVKHNALKLRANYQLPYKLVYYINQLDTDTDVKWVNILKYQTEKMLRVRGFYKKYKDEEENANKLIEDIRNEYLLSL